MPDIGDAAQEARARRAAARVGLKARKTRWRQGSIDNLGSFQLIDPAHNVIVAGARFDLSATDVIHYCSDRKDGATAPKTDEVEVVEEEPASDEVEVVEEEPAADEVEVVEEEPAADEVEVVEEEPASDEVEVVEEEPAADEVEVVEEEPASDEVEVVEEEPAADEVEVVEEELVAASVEQRPAAFRFRLRDWKVDVLPEPPNPEDREFALDTYQELAIKTRELHERLKASNSARRVCDSIQRLLVALGGSFDDLRPGVLLSRERSIAADRVAFSDELFADTIAMMDDVLGTLHNILAAFPIVRSTAAAAQ
jgi:hypothetical protein